MLVPPQNYGDFTTLLVHAARVFTDSGGVQKEAFYARVPCVTLRDNTEWVETVELGANVLAGWTDKAILAAVRRPMHPNWRARPYGDGRAAERIAAHLEKRRGRK